MDVTRIMRHLRSEQQSIEHAIFLSLEEYGNFTRQHSDSAKWILKIRQLIS